MRDIRSAFFVTHSQSVYLHTIRNPTAFSIYTKYFIVPTTILKVIANKYYNDKITIQL